MKNSLLDLNNHLFAQLERLGDEQLKGEALEVEINRAKAITSVSAQVISNANTVLQATKFSAEFGNGSSAVKPLSHMLECKQ